MKNILLTGASGGVGTMIRPLLLERWPNLLLSDRVEPPKLKPNERFQPADLANEQHVMALMKGIDGIVHLGGQSVEAEWDVVLESNISGLYNVYEAARVAGVKRIVFASSNHAIGFHKRSERIDNRVPVRPDSRYGVSKVFGEALGSLYADKHGMKITSLRIGNVGHEPLDKRRLSIWLHPEDLVQLINIGLTHPDIHHDILYGVSNNDRAWWDNSRAVELGYRPAYNSETFAADVLARNEKPDPVADLYQGGTFCAAEYTRNDNR